MSEKAVEFLKRAKETYPQTDLESTRTMSYLNEPLSNKESYEFLDALHYHVEGLRKIQSMTDEMKAHFKGLDIDGYFLWQLHMFVQEFIHMIIKMLGLDITAE